MKILHVGEYVQGGVATYIKALLNTSEYPMIENYLICSNDKSDHSYKIPKENIKYYTYQRSIFRIVLSMYTIFKHIRKIAPDVVYCHSTWAGVFVRLPLIFFRKRYRVIYNAHGWAFLREDSNWKKNIYAWIERILLRVTDIVINVSQYEYDGAKRYRLPVNKMRVIYSGIPSLKSDIDADVGFVPEKINLLFVGRLDLQKGVDFLLEEYRLCQRNNLHLTIIGDKVIGDNETIEKRDEPNLTFLGWISHERIAKYYMQCDAVVMPSRWEAFGLVAIEAMKYGKPVIASNRGALPELIKDGRNGYIFPFGEKGFLTNILENLTKQQLKILGMNGEELFHKKYLQSRMLKETISCYADGGILKNEDSCCDR